MLYLNYFKEIYFKCEAHLNSRLDMVPFMTQPWVRVLISRVHIEFHDHPHDELEVGPARRTLILSPHALKKYYFLGGGV